jgi:hypothetical protein
MQLGRSPEQMVENILCEGRHRANYENSESDWNSGAGQPLVGSSPMASASLVAARPSDRTLCSAIAPEITKKGRARGSRSRKEEVYTAGVAT